MKVEAKRLQIKGKWKSVWVKYVRENWKEWFVLDVGEGLMVPRFYLPVRRPIYKLALECWIFPLAPIVWIFYLVKAIVWLIAHDSVDWLRLLEAQIKDRKEDM